MFDREEVARQLRDAFLEGFTGYLDQWDCVIDGDLGGDPWGSMADAVVGLTRPISARQVNRLKDELAEALGWNGGDDEPDYEKADDAVGVVLSFFGLEVEGDG